MLNSARVALKANQKHPVVVEVLKILAIIVGAVLVGAGLELFLVPNGFLDGGVVGVSIILTNYVSVPLGVFIAVLNLPFLIVAYRHAGFKSAFRTALGIGALSVSTLLFHNIEPLTSEFVLALGYGGVLLGAGIGLALRFGGALDGTEILAVSLAAKMRFSVDQIILFVNFFIFLVAAFVLTPERAMASFLLFYVVVTPIIKKVMEGGKEMKTVQIMSSNHEAVADAVHNVLNRKVIFVDAHKDEPNGALKIVTTFIARVEEASLVEAIEAVDPDAIIVVTDAANLHGSIFAKTNHH